MRVRGISTGMPQRAWEPTPLSLLNTWYETKPSLVVALAVDLVSSRLYDFSVSSRAEQRATSDGQGCPYRGTLVACSTGS